MQSHQNISASVASNQWLIQNFTKGDANLINEENWAGRGLRPKLVSLDPPLRTNVLGSDIHQQESIPEGRKPPACQLYELYTEVGACTVRSTLNKFEHIRELGGILVW